MKPLLMKIVLPRSVPQRPLLHLLQMKHLELLAVFLASDCFDEIGYHHWNCIYQRCDKLCFLHSMLYARMVLGVNIYCIRKGTLPSFPRDMPLATLRVRPTAFTSKVLRPRNFLITNPERIVLTSGIPLPAAVYNTLTWFGFPFACCGAGYTDFVRSVRQADRILYAVAIAI